MIVYELKNIRWNLRISVVYICESYHIPIIRFPITALLGWDQCLYWATVEWNSRQIRLVSSIWMVWWVELVSIETEVKICKFYPKRNLYLNTIETKSNRITQLRMSASTTRNLKHGTIMGALDRVRQTRLFIKLKYIPISSSSYAISYKARYFLDYLIWMYTFMA